MLMTTKQVADRLNVQRHVVARWARERKIPSIRINLHSLRFEFDKVLCALKGVKPDKARRTPTAEKHHLITAKEVAEYCQTRAITVWVWTRQGRIPAIRVDKKCYRYVLADVMAALRKPYDD